MSNIHCFNNVATQSCRQGITNVEYTFQMDMSKDNPQTRRNAIKYLTTSAAGLGLITSSGTASAQKNKDGENNKMPKLNRNNPKKVWEYIREFGELSEQEQQNEWESLTKEEQELIKEALTPGEFVFKTEENIPASKDFSTASYSTKEVTNVVEAKSTFDLTTVFTWEHHVTWDYNGSNIENVNHYATYNVNYDIVSFWDYVGVDQKDTQPQADYTDVIMSGNFEFRFTQYGVLNRATAVSEVRVQEDGSWSVERDEANY